MAVAAGAVAVVGMASIAGAPAAWVLALRILVAGSSSSRVASPLMGEAVIGSIHEELQDRANTLINSGISIGVALSGPAALLVAEQWRLAWAAFALVGGVVVAWNAVVMPRKPVSNRRSEEATPADVPRLSVRYLIGPGAVPLFVAATGVGFASAAYWTFSRDLVVRSGDLSVTGSTLFWTVIGVFGLAGGLAGDLVRRFGLATAFRASLVCMAVATGMLAAAPGALLWAYLSAGLFGSTYIMLTGVILVWSVSIIHERPSAGLGAAFLLIAVGQFFGAPIAGRLAGAAGLGLTFWTFAGMAVLTALIGPRAERPLAA